MKIPEYIKGTLHNALYDTENTHVHLANLEEMLKHWERSELENLNHDNPEDDATNSAHPAWWRGYDQAVHVLCRKVNEILDGGSVRGISAEPWENTRNRIANLVTTVKHLGNAYQAPGVCNLVGHEVKVDYVEHDPMG